MRKLYRVGFTLMGTLLVCFLIAIIVLVSFFNPNNFKPQISQVFYRHTGRKLVLKGDIQWLFFPRLGLQLNDISLSNPPSFTSQPFAKLDQLKLQAKLLPLLKRRLEMEEFQFKGLELYLLKDKKGSNNWRDWTGPSAAKRVQTNATSLPSLQSLASAIAGIDIQRAHIIYQDQQSNQQYEINNLYLKSGAISSQHGFPLSLKCDLTAKPKLDASIEMTTDISLDFLEQSFRGDNFKFLAQLKGPSYPNGRFPISLQATIVGNLKDQTLTIDKLTGVMAKHSLTGQVIGEKITSSPLLSGQLTLPTLRLGLLPFKQVKLCMTLQDKVLTLNPITAKLYQGNYLGDARLDFRAHSPLINIRGQLTRLNAQMLFRDLTSIVHPIEARGLANFYLQFQTSGLSQPTLLRNLKGRGYFELNEGTIEGIDIAYWLARGKALLEQEECTMSDTRQTVFNALKGSFVANNGTFISHDLLVRSNHLQANGRGSVDVYKKRLDFQLEIQSRQTHEISIPIKITGPFANLSVRLGNKRLIGQIVERKLKPMSYKWLQKLIRKTMLVSKSSQDVV